MQNLPKTFTPSGTLTEIPLGAFPGVPGLFARLIALSLVRPARLSDDTRLAAVRVNFEGFRIDPGVVDRFKAICGYDGKDPKVPAPYVQTLFIGLISRFISSPHFPINPMGLIQVGQSYTQYEPLLPGMPLDLSCTLLDMTQTAKGIHTRFDLTASCQDRPVWQGVATYFTRAKNPPPKGPGTPKEALPLPVRETIEAPENIGRRYAGVSRDYNPHHLYPWTARFIGYKRAIAHGIWSLARAAASLEKAQGYPEAMSVEGALKLPIFLPSFVNLGYEETEDGILFELRDQKQGLPHLKGRFQIR